MVSGKYVIKSKIEPKGERCHFESYLEFGRV